VLEREDGRFQLIAQPAIRISRSQEVQARIEPGDNQRVPVIARQVVPPSTGGAHELTQAEDLPWLGDGRQGFVIPNPANAASLPDAVEHSLHAHSSKNSDNCATSALWLSAQLL